MRQKILAFILAIASTLLAQTPNVQFRAAQQKETVDGDLTAAIKLYRQVADGKSTPPALAARALVRLGQCYERLGSTEAAKAYERVVTQFGKEEAAAEARQRLASLPGKSGGNSEPNLVTRKVLGDLPWIQNTLTRDGRYTLVRAGLGLDLLDLVTASRKPIRGGAPLVSQTEYSRGPYVISPDGRQFAFWVAPPDRGELRVAHIDGSGIRTLASLPGKLKIQPFDWSDDSHTILAAPFSREGAASEFLLVNTNDQTTRSIRISGNIGGQARFSPDKQWIVFERVRNGEASLDEMRRGDLFMIRVDGSGERQLVQWEDAVSLAGWSPDGGSVLFVSKHLGTDHLWAVPVKDGAAASAPVSVMKGFSPVRVMGMTRQGVLLYSTGSWGNQPVIARLDGPGGTPTITHREKSQSRMFGLSPAWSPDGRYLAYEFRDVVGETGPMPASVVIVRDLASGKEREIGQFRGFRRRLSWTPDSKSLLVPVKTAGGSNVLRLDVASGKSEPLIPATLLDSQSVPSFPQLSPDGKYLYYLQTVPPKLTARLMRLDLAQAQAKQIATVQQLYALSPSGNEFVAPVADEAGGKVILRVIGANGETLRDLITVNAPEALTSAEWSPDGRQIYFARTLTGDQSGIFRIAAAGGSPVALGIRGVAYPDFRIRPDGKEVAFVIVDQQMEVWRLEGLPQALARALRASPNQDLVARKVLGDLPWVVKNTLTRDGRYTLVRVGHGLELLDLTTGQKKPVGGRTPLFSAKEISPGFGFVISPDGLRFAFEISAPGHGELRVANIDGAGFRTLASMDSVVDIHPLDWSRDGRTILAVPIRIEPGPDEFLLVDANGKESRTVRVTGLIGKRAKLSPDGQWIAFEKVRSEEDHYRSRGDLWIVRTDGSGERQLVQHVAATNVIGWSLDGGSVLFVSEQVGVDHLWAVPVKAGVAVSRPVSIVKGFNQAGVLGLAPDGALLYASGGNDLQVFTARMNGSGGGLSTPQPISSRGLTASPAWSPDGRLLSYLLMEPDHPEEVIPAVSTLMVRDVSTGREREVARISQAVRRTSWTSDSKSLLIPSITSAGRNVLRVDLDSGKSEPLIPAPLTDSHSYYAFPQMSPDGRYLYYVQTPISGVAARLMQLDLAQQQARQLATVSVFFALSPDGSALVAPVVDGNTTVLRVLGPDGKTRRDLIAVPPPDQLTSAAWSADGREVFFTKTIGGKNAGFFRVPVSGGSPAPLGDFTLYSGDLSVHPNGSDLVFVGRRSDLEIWRLEGLSQALTRALTPRTQAAHAKQ